MANCIWEGTTSGDYSVAGNWVGAAVPIAGDSVRIPATSTREITAGLNQSAVGLVDFIAEEGAPAMGIETANLQIAVSGKFRFAASQGSTPSFIDIGTSAIIPQVDGTVATPTLGSVTAGICGLYLIGSAFSLLLVNGGKVGFAWRLGETASATNIRVAGSTAILWIGSGVTNTGLQQTSGATITHGSTTTITMDGGTLTTKGSMTCSVNCNGGTMYPNSSGTITAMNLNGGDAIADFTTCGVARIVSTMKQERKTTLKYHPASLTISAWSAPTYAVAITADALGNGGSTWL